jgi:hypothetical protein
MPHAVVNFVRLDDPAAAAASTSEVVLPRLRQLSGFAQAIFLADEQGERGFRVMVFQTEDQAVGMAERFGSGQVPTPPGVTFERQEM